MSIVANVTASLADAASNEAPHLGGGMTNGVGAAAKPCAPHAYTSQCVCPTVESHGSEKTTRSGAPSAVRSKVSNRTVSSLDGALNGVLHLGVGTVKVAGVAANPCAPHAYTSQCVCP